MALPTFDPNTIALNLQTSSAPHSHFLCRSPAHKRLARRAVILPGGRMIQHVADTYSRRDITERINDQLQRV